MIFSTTKGVNYKLNFNRIVFDFLPKKFRKLKIFNYLTSAVFPLILSNNKFLNYIEDTTYIMNVSNQTMIFERYLRDKFSNENINVINSSTEQSLTFLYNISESGDIGTSENFIFNSSESIDDEDEIYLYSVLESTEDYDFKIEIPSELILAGVSTVQILEIANIFKPVGTIAIVKVI